MNEPGRRLLTVGHGTLESDEFTALLRGAGIQAIVDVRSAPGSRRHPQFGRGELESWLPDAGIAYHWGPDLGGFRKPSVDSPNVALRNAAFRGYADFMRTTPFIDALNRTLDDASRHPVAIMCAESLWWRCHRRLIADAAELLFDTNVQHLSHDGRLSPHRLTDGVRVEDSRHLMYDVIDQTATWAAT